MLILHPADIHCPEFDAWWDKNKADMKVYQERFGLSLEDLGRLIWVVATEKAEEAASENEKYSLIHAVSMAQG
jgi:hypothetical protein